MRCYHQRSTQRNSETQAYSWIASKKYVMYTATQPNKLSVLPLSSLQYSNLFEAFHDLYTAALGPKTCQNVGVVFILEVHLICKRQQQP